MENGQLFTVAGVSTLEGVMKARLANELTRVKVLEKNGHTNVRLVTLPGPMTKEDAVAFLRTHADYQDAEAQVALAPEAPKVPKEAKVKVAKEPKAAKTVKAPKAPKTVKAPTEGVVGSEFADKKTAIMAKNKATIKETMDKINTRKAEELAAANAAFKEQAALEVDNFMADALEMPAFLRS
jgi:hypothetical protein